MQKIGMNMRELILEKKYAGYMTQYGRCYCVDSLIGLQYLEDCSVDLIMTSPPFALQRKKEYGNEEQEDYIKWFLSFAEKAFVKLKDTGSFVIDLGGAYNKNEPSYCLYQFKLLIELCDNFGFKLAQPFYWHNPSALPAPIEWVNKRKLRAKNSVNTIWWLCKDPNKCKANISNVLTPYSDRMLKLLKRPNDFLKEDKAIRPSGHILNLSSWNRNNGGAIPSNMLQFPNTESNSQYLRYCKCLNLKSHPARYPLSLPEFFIKFLTEERDCVVDIFAGSNTTGNAAEKLHRHWISFELSKEYVASSAFRFCDDFSYADIIYKDILNNQFVNLNEFHFNPKLPLLG